jgi:hypothetical protein
VVPQGWGSSGIFQPEAVSFVMALKQFGLGISMMLTHACLSNLVIRELHHVIAFKLLRHY